MMITQERLKHLLLYDPETGVFRNRIKRSKKTIIGDIAGCVAQRGERGRKLEYRVIMLDKVLYLAHHLAWLYMNGELPKEIDHKDRNGLNNSISNLRLCTRAQNNQNTHKTIIAASGLRGAFYDKGRSTKPFYSRIRVNNKAISLGYFGTAEEAHQAYMNAAVKYYGEFVDIHRQKIGTGDEKTRGSVIA